MLIIFDKVVFLIFIYLLELEIDIILTIQIFNFLKFLKNKKKEKVFHERILLFNDNFFRLTVSLLNGKCTPVVVHAPKIDSERQGMDLPTL